MSYVNYMAPASGPVLLLHFDGTDGSTTIVDSSRFARTLTGHAAASISTTQSKWGSSSLKILRSSSNPSGGNQGLQIGYTADFANSNNQPQWVDFWIYHNAQPGEVLTLFYDEGIDTGAIDQVQVTKLSGTIYTRLDTEIYGIDESFPYALPLTANTWQHVAMGFDGTTLRRFVDGQVAFSESRSVGPNTQRRVVVAGIPSATNTTSDGFTVIYIDELRYLIGECPYTSNFTPPTGPY